MKSQHIEVKTVIEVITEEEISYTEAERLAHEVVSRALEKQLNNIVERTENLSPPFFNFEVSYAQGYIPQKQK
jgi:hypothetical protein